LSATGLGDDGARVIATAKRAAQLTSLELSDNKLTQEGVFAIAEAPQLAGLQRLLFNDAWLGKKAVLERLAGSPVLVYVKGTLISGKAKKEASERPKPAPAKGKGGRAKAAGKPSRR
jgi:hypothetical protein